MLEEAREYLVALPGAAASILEISHRSPVFKAVIEEAESNLRQLLEIPARHRVLFAHGGASLKLSSDDSLSPRGPSCVPRSFRADRGWRLLD